MLRFINSKRSKYLFYASVLVTSVVGVVNLLINYSTLVESVADRSWWQIPFAFLSVFIMAFISQAANVVALSLICYFTCAAMNTGFETIRFIRMAAKALVISPWLTFTDTIGFLVFGQKLVSFGMIGLLSYVPFYVGVAYLIYNVAPQYVSLDHRGRKILALVAGIAMILLSYPN